MEFLPSEIRIVDVFCFPNKNLCNSNLWQQNIYNSNFVFHQFHLLPLLLLRPADRNLYNSKFLFHSLYNSKVIMFETFELQRIRKNNFELQRLLLANRFRISKGTKIHGEILNCRGFLKGLAENFELQRFLLGKQKTSTIRISDSRTSTIRTSIIQKPL